ncbi:MAG: starch synthase [Chlorobiales bacterium]|nr:starch synthase [Chlorobiales bacterium]
MTRSTCKVLYVSGEISPFVRISSLADFMASFPQAMEDEGCEARIMMPKYGVINDRKFRLHDVLRLSDIKVPLKDKTDLLHVKVTALPSSKIQTYFLYNEKYFKRNGLFKDMVQGNDFKGSAERVIFFNLGILETLQRLGWKPDIIHFHDWYASLVPLLLKTVYADNAFFKGVKTVLTVHNAHSQGVFPLKPFKKLLPEIVVDGLYTGDDDTVNMLFTGIEHANRIATTSIRYAELISNDTEAACGVDKILASRGNHLEGITNGLDIKQWNPSADKLIKKKFDTSRLDEKLENKRYLLEELSVSFDEDVPLIGAMVNFDRFQGVELLLDSLDKLMQLDIRMVISGSGDKDIQKKLENIALKYKGKLGLNWEFTDAFFHQIMASADVLLMPGKLESCGMMQFFAMRYGTLPIIYGGGGIAETVDEINARHDGSGFVFHEYSSKALVGKVKEVISIYGDKERWARLVTDTMERDMSWKDSAEKYTQIYLGLLERA